MKKIMLGDLLALFLTTLVGFITHGETDLSFLPRFLAAFLPLVVAWFLLAPWFGLFQPDITSNPKQLWRPVLAMLFAAPLAAVLRGLILNTAILPIFVVVLGATSVFGVLIWRALFWRITQNNTTATQY
jgi:ABC-type xylose transport system permease subunit